MNMPQRTREHQLETESRRAFENLIPSLWVVREVAYDYGVDLEVEIFDDGAATGKTFRVQLKGTDRPAKNRRATVRVDSRKLTYWRELDTPVLVVLYLAGSGDVYCQWAHSYDPFYSKQHDDPATVTFSFGQRDRMGPATYDRIGREVGLIRNLRSRNIVPPIPLRLDLPENFQGNSPNSLRAQFRQAILSGRSAIDLVDEDPDAIVLALDKSKIVVRLPAQVASTTLHVDDEAYAGADGVKTLIADSLVAVGSLLARIGLPQVAAPIAIRFAPQSRVTEFPEAMELLVDAFLAGNFLRESLRLVLPAIDSPESAVRDHGSLLMSKIFLHRDVDEYVDEGDYRALIDRLESKAVLEVSGGEVQKAGTTWYTVSHYRRTVRDSTEALAALDRAASCDPNYLSREYFFGDRGGVNFLLGRFEDAARDYRSAVDLSRDTEVPFLLSNALMYAGKFAEATSVDVIHERVPQFYQLGARIQSRVLRTIVAVLGLTDQVRQLADNSIIDEIAKSGSSPGEITNVLQETDGLDPRLWALLAAMVDDKRSAADFMVVAAELARSSEELWAAAIALNAEADASDPEIEDVCNVALRYVKSEVFAAIERMSNEGVSEAARQRALAKLYECGNRDPMSPPRVIRFHEPDGSYRTLDLSY